MPKRRVGTEYNFFLCCKNAKMLSSHRKRFPSAQTELDYKMKKG